MPKKPIRIRVGTYKICDIYRISCACGETLYNAISNDKYVIFTECGYSIKEIKKRIDNMLAKADKFGMRKNKNKPEVDTIQDPLFYIDYRNNQKITRDIVIDIEFIDPGILEEFEKKFTETPVRNSKKKSKKPKSVNLRLRCVYRGK